MILSSVTSILAQQNIINTSISFIL